MARRHKIRNQSKRRKTRNGCKRNDEQVVRSNIQTEPEKSEFFKKEAEWIGHKIDQNGIRPLQDKLEAITKIEQTKNEKETKVVSGSKTIFV